MISFQLLKREELNLRLKDKLNKDIMIKIMIFHQNLQVLKVNKLKEINNMQYI